MRRSHIVSLLLILALSVFAAGCGGGKKSAESGVDLTCDGTALTTDTGLPPDFPMWDEVTLTNVEHQGPTLVVNGFFTGDGKIQSAHDEYKNRFEAAGYAVLFDEVEDKDSEVSYKTKDGKTSGQVAMKAECDNGHISVHITARPA